MKILARPRFIALCCLIACLIGTIIACAIASLLRIREVRSHFAQVQRTQPGPTGRLREKILDLNYLLTRFEASNQPEELEKFQKRSLELGKIMEEDEARLTGQSEHAVFEQIKAAYVRYLAEAKAITQTNSAGESRTKFLSRLTRIENASKELLALTSDLSAIRRQSVGQFVRESETSLVRLQQVIFTALGLLLFLAAWALRVIYRDTIAPLRLKLIETRELAERQEKLASLGTLASGVAHEIRNPLTAIKARLFTQQKALAPGSPAQRDAEFISAAIDRLERIVCDFLAFARPREPQLEAVSASEMFQRVRDLLSPETQQATINLEIGNCTETKCLCDSQQVEQVLINLVRNAAESIESKGRITLKARATQMPLSDATRHVVILEVQDTGRGIPQDVQERLFDPFFSTKSSGTGLGLSIAARIVEQHGGALQYQSEVNRGTTFAVILPAMHSS